ncbi:MAG TPA: hypothetical protein VGG84_08150 [Gemmatimonadaceae bacterium]
MTRLTLAWVVAAALSAADARAQGPNDPRLAPELRADVIAGRQPAVQVGGGMQIPAGYYMRIGLDAAIGLRTDAPPGGGSSSRVDGRLDLLTRFLLDPFRQSSYGLSIGGGLTLRAEPNDRVRPLLLVAVDVEGRRRQNGLVPALQVGLGGGLRVGVILRRSATLMAR